MPNDDPSVTKRLLSPSNMDKAVIENEMENNDNRVEADLRLHDAVYDPENIEEIKELLAENPNLVFERDEDGRTPLHTLALAGDEEAPDIAKLLLGVPTSGDGKAGKGLSRPGLLDLTDSKGFTALHYAARNWQPTLVSTLLKFGANSNFQDAKGNTPLHFAAEGNTDNAVECVREILKYDKHDGSMVNSRNSDQLTPLHMAIKDQAVKIVPLLLKSEFKFDLSVQNKLGQTVLHFICLEPGETEKTCEIMKAVVECCNPQQLNMSDCNQRSVLHIAAIERLPQFTRILVQDNRTDVLKVDNRKRTALHYATENGCYPKGHQCVESLISRSFVEQRDLIRYLYQTKDDMENTPFMYASLNCPTSTMQKYLSVIPKPQFWMTETSMLLIYKQSPLSVKALMDKAFSERKKTKDQDVIFTDFGPVTGYIDPVENLPQQETKYLKQAMFWDYETQKEILLHPLVQSFVVKKWEKLRVIILTWIFWQIVWLAAYTLLAMTTYSGGIDSKITAVLAAFIMLVYVVASVINELFESVAIGWSYFLSITNWSQIFQNVLAIGAIWPVFAGSDAPGVWNKHAAAMGILLAYILSMKDIGKLHNMIGLVVEVLKQVVVQILQVLLCCSPLLIGFTLAFVILFDNDESLNTAFPGPLVKVLVMMTGEFEYNDTFNGDGEKNATTTYRAVRLVFFLSFLIAVPVAFFNLLTGFALDKVMELRERAKVGRIAKQLEHIYFIESILLSLSPLRKICSPEVIVNWLRRRNVTTALIDGKLQFETVLEEETRTKLDRRSLKDRRLDFWKCGLQIYGTELPVEVRNEIYALASSSSGKDECVCSCPCQKCVDKKIH